MNREYEIRAQYDRDSIVVYQAYSDAIADAAIRAQAFVPPFSYHRMTWIKPSLLWLMHRSNWGQKKGQQRTLAVHVDRDQFDQALTQGVLTHFEPGIHGSSAEWRRRFDSASVHVQWDTERSVRGAPQNRFSIQVGIGRKLIEAFALKWVIKIIDLSATVQKVRSLLKRGHEQRAKRLLPSERVYPLPTKVGKSLMLSPGR